MRVQPRGVAPDHELFVIGLGVMVGPGVAQHDVEHPQQLVRGGHDGALVAAAYHQRLVVAAELAAMGTRRAMRALDEHRAPRLAARASAGRAALAGALAVARTPPAHAARRSALPKASRSGPISARMAHAEGRSMPGMVWSRAMRSRHGSRPASMSRSSPWMRSCKASCSHSRAHRTRRSTALNSRRSASPRHSSAPRDG